MRIGKLDNRDLSRLILDKFQLRRPETVAGPAIGADCAVVDPCGDLIALSTDPITSASYTRVGSLTVHVCCNDAASIGAEPIGLMVTLLAPPSVTEDMLARIADDLAEAALLANVDILGGHTEITDAVTRPITSCTVVARLNRTVRPRGMQEGDEVIMTKFAGLEGSLMIAEDAEKLLPGYDAAELKRLCALSACLSVVPEARIAVRHGATAMHDVTEGGVLGALWELSTHAGVGLLIDRDAISVLPETRHVCARLALDPYKLIGSGSLLIAAADATTLLLALHAADIPAVRVAKACGAGVRFTDGTAVEPPQADEIYRLFQ